MGAAEKNMKDARALFEAANADGPSWDTLSFADKIPYINDAAAARNARILDHTESNPDNINPYVVGRWFPSLGALIDVAIEEGKDK